MTRKPDGAELEWAVLGAYVMAVIFFACLSGGGGRCSCRVDSRPSEPSHAEAP